ncbi:hypothetical protein EVAR_102928_1 [Eumeta japonica]|uniref:Uncharacterized protein n=1 Tax=Eumeta variegata TaxID=151549 RepID=A0A4C2A245_EUMVA|nr:hypothetical protein EVAR_102928_1 [Eumeta japonica]
MLRVEQVFKISPVEAMRSKKETVRGIFTRMLSLYFSSHTEMFIIRRVVITIATCGTYDSVTIQLQDLHIDIEIDIDAGARRRLRLIRGVKNSQVRHLADDTDVLRTIRLFWSKATNYFAMKVLTALYGYDHEPFRAYGTTHETLPLTIALELCIAHGRRSPTLASSPPRSYLRHCDAFVTNFKEAEFSALY